MNSSNSRRLGWRIALAAASVAALVLGPAVAASADDPVFEVSGTVVDPSSSPVGFGSAELFGSDPTTEVGYSNVESDGSFVFSGVSAGTYRIEITGNNAFHDGWDGGASDYADATPIQVTDSDVTGVTITLQPVVYTLQGTVTGGPSNTPLAGQTVELWDQGSSAPLATTTTDNTGRYLFSGLSADDNLTLHFAGGGGWAQEWWQNEYASFTATLIDDQSNPTFEVNLARAGTLSGRVTNYGTSTPVAGADVTVQDAAGDTYITDVTTDARGYYAISGLAAGQYKVNAVGPDFANFATQSDWERTWYPSYERLGFGTLVTVPGDGGATNINIGLHRNTRIEGVITDASTKKPFSVATINLVTTSGAVVQTVGTNANGFYEFDDVTPGEYKVQDFSNQRTFSDFGSDVSDWYGGSALSTARVIHATADQTTSGVNIALQHGGFLGGAVSSDPLGFTPNTEVELKTTTGVVVQTGFVFNGQWGFLADPGTYIAQFISKDGYYSGGYYNTGGYLGDASRITIRNGSNLTLPSVSLGHLPLGTITGHVKTADGSPLPTTVTAERYPTTDYGEAAPQPATVQPDGSFTISDVPAGPYTIVYGNNDVGPAAYLNRYDQGSIVTVTSGHTLALSTQTVTHNVTVTGTITDGGQPAYFAQVEFYTLGGTLVTSAVTAQDGTYSAQVPSGKYRVRFFEGPDQSWGATWLGGGQSFSLSDVLDTSLSTEADGTLVPGSTITGQAVDATDGLSVDGLNVIVFRLDPDGTWSQATGGDGSTDGTGHYTITGLSTGTYVLQFSETTNNYINFATSYDGRSTSIAGAKPFVISSIGQLVTAPTAYMLRAGSVPSGVTRFLNPAHLPSRHPSTTGRHVAY